MNLAQLIPILQLAVGPAILISGVGLLLLSMTNRLGRTIDRSRVLIERRGTSGDRGQDDAQLEILWQRALLLRSAITFAATSVLLAAVLVIVLFAGALAQLEIAWLLAVLFVCCLVALIASLVLFLRDINLSLRALALETGANDR